MGSHKIERERVFIVSIRKDVDNGIFEFPKPFPLKKRLKDVLENEVDEKYFIQDDKVIPFIKKHIDDVEPLNPTPDGICRTIKSQYYKNSQANFIKQSDQGATGVIVNERENKPKLIGNIYNEKI